MAIEGPLRELGVTDVFQLLDLSRKTGTLAVTSELRDNAGMVQFERGKVVGATIRSNPHRIGELLLRAGKVSEAQIQKARTMQGEGDGRRLGEILVAMGAINAKELERQMRMQIEAVVFELLSWGEGFFRFEEGPVGPSSTVEIGTESLLMEGARRIDEWSRIADRVPSLAAIPVFAEASVDGGPQLDLLPSEWEVMTRIDGAHDLRSIAAELGRSDFEVAKVVYGLVSTGVVELRMPTGAGANERASVVRVPTPIMAMPIVTPISSPAEALDRAAAAVAAAAPTPAAMPAVTPSATPAHALGAPPEPTDDLDRGFYLLRRGDFEGAAVAWERVLHTEPHHEHAEEIRAGLAAAARLRAMLETWYGN
ncbi:MAG: DUF4388 domain-containing protein [Gemmatimonadetes bacterium]|nr:DUF4388 domain-containing protein [Gemmatimonadota bacterium]